jgi:hypothetical protein
MSRYNLISNETSSNEDGEAFRGIEERKKNKNNSEVRVEE